MIRKQKWVIFSLFLVLVIIAGVFRFDDFGTMENDPNISAADVTWMLTATALVLFMTPGLSFFYGGMVRTKNVISTMLQSFIAMGVVSIVWVVVGFSLAFGDSLGPEKAGLIGNPFTYFMFRNVGFATDPKLAPTIPLALFALFQLKFAIITPALITGSFAERVKFSAYLVYMVLFTLFIYAPLAHWTWHPNGFLKNLGVLDFAGGTVVHMSAGFSALAGAIFLGKRKYSKTPYRPANIPFILLGAGMLWFGWFGFNAGSSLEASPVAVSAFLNTNMASATAMLTWVFFDRLQGRKVSAIGAAVGAVVGLVAITPAAGFVSVGSSLFIGATAAIVSNIAVHWKDKTSLDDALDVFPAHGVGGMVGMLLTAVFARNTGLLYGQTATMIAHLIGLVIVAVFTFGGSYLLYWVTNKMIPMRVSSHSEAIGLDLSQHDEQYGGLAEEKREIEDFVEQPLEKSA
ncbi:MAG: ammonium transporter [Chlorobi bacterium]|nr:ammonium transporter [Chlorobiota bacterium]